MPADPQPDHGHDEEAHRKIAEAVLADPNRDHPAHPDRPHARDEDAEAVPPPWAEDDTHPGPVGWHREPGPDGEHVWVADK